MTVTTILVATLVALVFALAIALGIRLDRFEKLLRRQEAVIKALGDTPEHIEGNHPDSLEGKLNYILALLGDEEQQRKIHKPTFSLQAAFDDVNTHVKETLDAVLILENETEENFRNHSRAIFKAINKLSHKIGVENPVALPKEEEEEQL